MHFKCQSSPNSLSLWVLLMLLYGPGIYTDSHLFGRKLTKRCESMYLSSNLSLSMEMYQDSHLLAKRCESLYIPDPYLTDQECTRIHTFSNKMPKTIKNEKVWILVYSWPIPYGRGIYKDSHIFRRFQRFCIFCKFFRDGNLQGFTPFQNLIVESLVRKWPYSWCLIYFITSSDLT